MAGLFVLAFALGKPETVLPENKSVDQSKSANR